MSKRFFDGLNGIQDRNFKRLKKIDPVENIKIMLSFEDRPKCANTGEIWRFKVEKPYLDFWSSGKKYKFHASFGTKTRDNGDSETSSHVKLYPNYMCDVVL